MQMRGGQQPKVTCTFEVVQLYKEWEFVHVSLPSYTCEKFMSSIPPVVVPASGNNIVISSLQVHAHLRRKEIIPHAVYSEGIQSWSASEILAKNLEIF